MKILIVSLVMLMSLCVEPLTPRGFAQQDAAVQMQDVLVALNALRTNPASFVPKLRAYRDIVAKRTKNVAALDAAIAEATERLSKEKSLSALNMQGALLLAAQDHAADISKNNVVGHTGSDKSTPSQRVKKYAPLASVAEVITYGYTTADMIIASFIVDQDTPNRGHREILLSEKYTMVGIAIAKHKTYTTACVMVLGGM